MQGGSLPPGIHEGSPADVAKRFGWNEHRRRLLTGLEALLRELSRNGCKRAWLGGSFVSAKDMPGDFDLVGDPDGVDLTRLDDVLINDLAPPRTAQHVKYGGDVLPNVVEASSGMPFLDFFQQDSVTGDTRGIVELDLGGGR